MYVCLLIVVHCGQLLVLVFYFNICAYVCLCMVWFRSGWSCGIYFGRGCVVDLLC